MGMSHRMGDVPMIRPDRYPPHHSAVVIMMSLYLRQNGDVPVIKPDTVLMLKYVSPEVLIPPPHL